MTLVLCNFHDNIALQYAGRSRRLHRIRAPHARDRAVLLTLERRETFGFQLISCKLFSGQDWVYHKLGANRLGVFFVLGVWVTCNYRHGP